MKKRVLLENGLIHTDYLSESDAKELEERYFRIFPENDYSAVEMTEHEIKTWGRA